LREGARGREQAGDQHGDRKLESSNRHEHPPPPSRRVLQV
jgi:hypothetical protein